MPRAALSICLLAEDSEVGAYLDGVAHRTEPHRWTLGPADAPRLDAELSTYDLDTEWDTDHELRERNRLAGGTPRTFLYVEVEDGASTRETARRFAIALLRALPGAVCCGPGINYWSLAEIEAGIEKVGYAFLSEFDSGR